MTQTSENNCVAPINWYFYSDIQKCLFSISRSAFTVKHRKKSLWRQWVIWWVWISESVRNLKSVRLSTGSDVSYHLLYLCVINQRLLSVDWLQGLLTFLHPRWMETKVSGYFSQIRSACVFSILIKCKSSPIEISPVNLLQIGLWGENIKTSSYRCRAYFSSFIQFIVWLLKLLHHKGRLKGCKFPLFVNVSVYICTSGFSCSNGFGVYQTANL